jgi:hypothetical protein
LFSRFQYLGKIFIAISLWSHTFLNLYSSNEIGHMRP